MSKVVIFGVGQISEVALFYLQNDSEHNVVGFTVDEHYRSIYSFHGLPVVAFETIREVFPPSEYKLLIPISYNKMNEIREQKYCEAKEMGYSFVSYISSKAIYYGTEVGENCMILENNIIQPYSRIGNNVIIWSGGFLGHHSIIENNCFIASQVVISGSTKIGVNCFVGANATVRDNVKIGDYNIIGAGAVILKDTEDYDVYTANNGTVKIAKKSVELKRI